MEAPVSRAIEKLTHPLLWAEVNTGHLAYNARMLRSLVSPGVATLAVVKANAYGHGLTGVAKALQEHVDGFGVSSLSEAVRLRRSGIRHPVLIFGHLAADEFRQAFEWDLSLSVSDVEYGMGLGSEAQRTGFKAKIHVKVDTGMGRFGIPLREALRSLQDLARSPVLELEGLYTHLAQAEKSGDGFTRTQILRFSDLRKALDEQGLQFAWVHAGASSAVVQYPESHFSLIRPGLMLYGLYPHPSLRGLISLKPALTLRAKWVLIKKIAAGDTVGYGRTYIADRDTWIGILPMGYSHGYPWGLSGKARVFYRGVFYSVVGRISMDSIAVDLGSETEAAVGDDAVLMGGEEGAGIPLEELAGALGTIPYEIVSRLDPDIPRIYRD